MHGCPTVSRIKHNEKLTKKGVRAEPSRLFSLYLHLHTYAGDIFISRLSTFAPRLASAPVIGQESKCYRHHSHPPALPSLLSAPFLLPLQALLSRAAGASSWLLWSVLLGAQGALVRTSCISAGQTADFVRPCPASVPAALDRLLPCGPSGGVCIRMCRYGKERRKH